MIKIAIELNHVLRNVNKQILKYYQKDIDPELDIEDIDEKDDVFKYVDFDGKKSRNEFIYIDYPYEIFGCAKTMTKNLPTEMNNWLSELTNYEDDDVYVFFYSLDEEALTIQSSYFFLSKIGTRVRKIIFPQSIEELKGECDVIITANENVVKEFAGDENVYKILINRPTNEELKEKSDKNYDSLSDVLNDDELLNTLHTWKITKEEKV